MPMFRFITVPLLVGLAAGCGAAAQGAAAPPLQAAARSARDAGCSELGPRPPPPRPTPSSADGARADVALYTAHPDDESMYAGGTLRRLTAAGHRVAVVIASHGEGGRLLERDAQGGLVERRDLPRSVVTDVRDREMARAAQIAGLELDYLYPGDANVDFAFTRSCAETLGRWERDLPGGLAAMLERLVTSLRRHRPRVVVAMDPRDDPGGSRHGHHRALGALTERAARLAARPEVGCATEPCPAPHAIEELWRLAPKDAAADLELEVDVDARLEMLHAHRSQFPPDYIEGFGSRPHERFVLAWGARGNEATPQRTVFASLLAP